MQVVPEGLLLVRLNWMKAQLRNLWKYRYEDKVELTTDEMLLILLEWAASDFEWIRGKMAAEKEELLFAKKDGGTVYGLPEDGKPFIL